MEHIPKIREDQVKEQSEVIRAHIVKGEVQQWLDESLQGLHDTNPVLYHYIVERAHKLAVGATMASNPQSIAVSIALEYINLLNLLSTGIGSAANLKKFGLSMDKWFPNGLDLKGIGDGNGK